MEIKRNGSQSSSHGSAEWFTGHDAHRHRGKERSWYLRMVGTRQRRTISVQIKVGDTSNLTYEHSQ